MSAVSLVGSERGDFDLLACATVIEDLGPGKAFLACCMVRGALHHSAPMKTDTRMRSLEEQETDEEPESLSFPWGGHPVT